MRGLGARFFANLRSPLACPASPCIRQEAGLSSPPTRRRLPGVSATLVKIVFFARVAIALGLVFAEVPGATPKNPASGLIACSRPFPSGRIQAMSSPTVQTFQPSKPSGGISIAKFVLPHALGKLPRHRSSRPPDFRHPQSACARPSSLHRAPCSTRCVSAKHFLPNSAFPP